MAEKKTGTRCRGPRLGLLADGYDYEFRHAFSSRPNGRRASTVSISSPFRAACSVVASRDPKRFVYDIVGPDCVDALLICTHTIGHHSTLAELTDFVGRFSAVPRVC